MIKMKKQIKVTLKTNDEELVNSYLAIKTNNKIIYQEKEYKVTLNINENVKLIRENEEYLFELPFEPNKKTTGTCCLKKEKSKINMDILTDYVIIEDDYLIIKYEVLTTNQEVIFKLEV